MSTIERRNIVGLQKVTRLLAQDLSDNGFSVLSVNNSSTNVTLDDSTTKILLGATEAVDVLAIEDTDTGHANFANRQPWRLSIEVDEAAGGIQIAACSPTNIKIDETGAYELAVFASKDAQNVQRSGLMTYQSFDNSDNHGKKHVILPQGKMITDSKAYTFNIAYWGMDLANIDYESIPFSYRVSITPRGLMFFIWIESRDGEGSAYGWFNIQRMVDASGNTVVDGKSPLYCTFSPNGGGGGYGPGATTQKTIVIDGETFDSLNAPSTIGILKFVVREQDINAPTVPHSAVTDTADSSRIINSVQQVSTSEDNKFILNFPKGLNSHRYSYPHELDMFAFTSADVISQWSETELTVYGEISPRKYKAMNANHANNKGMRILMLVEGGGV